IEREIFDIAIAAESAADIKALERQVELGAAPQHLLHVRRTRAPPDLQHGTFLRDPAGDNNGAAVLANATTPGVVYLLPAGSAGPPSTIASRASRSIAKLDAISSRGSSKTLLRRRQRHSVTVLSRLRSSTAISGWNSRTIAPTQRFSTAEGISPLI